ncbi:hypothetical protein HDA32_003395 [Spinactinospora alkalitolerans]|uniref:Uncharacterized protein n=1 Tax=Spinactinospora alkalitolerans TaxID=687207 RepID=A0A852TY60_9ACTN|nr:hypothetical protein [Spinactinospora alkalitolerans]NYE48275.1 hypothetical protein [Spinactinospora alkalitolerans]
MDRYEWELRRALRWYPPHYRERHGEEIIATALELRELDELEVSRAERWGLVKAGLLTRLRERPPFPRWLAYRLLGVRVPFRYRMWVRDEVLGRWFGLRTSATSLSFYFLLLIPFFWLTGSGESVYTVFFEPRDVYSFGVDLGSVPLAAVIGVWGGVTVALTWATLGFGRRRILRKHGFHPDGTSLEWTRQRCPDGRMHRLPD